MGHSSCNSPQGRAECKNVLYAAARANGPACSVWQKAPGETPVHLQSSLLELGIQSIWGLLYSSWKNTSLIKGLETWAALERVGAEAQLFQLPSDCQCWAECSKGGSSLCILQLVLHEMSVLQWPYNELKQETPVVQESWKLSQKFSRIFLFWKFLTVLDCSKRFQNVTRGGDKMGPLQHVVQ